MPKRKGFSLIELLVTISIIAILSSVLLPALGKARNTAKSAYCLNLLNQLGKADAMYYNDYNCFLPIYFGPAAAPFIGAVYWHRNPGFVDFLGIKMGKFDNGTDVPLDYWPDRWLCPMARRMTPKDLGDTHEVVGEPRFLMFNSYGRNYEAVDCMSTEGLQGVKVKSLQRPADKICVIDTNSWRSKMEYSDPSRYATYGEKTYGNPYRVRYAHRNRANILFYDGHCGNNGGLETFNNVAMWDISK